MGHTSPPPPYNFLHLPTVNGREALWDAAPDQPVVVGLDDDARSFLTTRMLDAEPDGHDEFPAPTIWPFLAAIATTVASSAASLRLGASPLARFLLPLP